jgi:hypothetical protein
VEAVDQFYLDPEGDPRTPLCGPLGCARVSPTECIGKWALNLFLCPCTFGILWLFFSCEQDTFMETDFDQIMCPLELDLRNLELTQVFGQFDHKHTHTHYVFY